MRDDDLDKFLNRLIMGWVGAMALSMIFGMDAMINFFFAPIAFVGAAGVDAIGITIDVLGVFAWPFFLMLLLGGIGILLFPLYEIGRDYPRNTFERDAPFREVRKARNTTAECVNCGAEFEGGYVIQFGRETVVAGVVTEKILDGYHYECAPCREDPIEASLRAGREDPNIPEVDRNDHDLDGLVICRMCETPNVESRTHCGECDHPLPLEASDGG